MRLLSTEEPVTGNFQITEFKEEEVPKYAILSHTWESEEVTLKDIEGPCIPNKQGYEKIRNCCAIARNAGFKYAWVDTCCIDKTSSAELSEAINSMYRWYQQADICYAYLADVPAGQTGPRLPPDCKWFTRGWTLQELIAPAELIFLDQEWGQIGSKSEPGLQEEIYKITNIPIGILSGDDIETASIAQRMSWAANRRTTRLEDRAYCLMGIFDINMPLLYGEGVKAFIRLQEEIIKISDDHSIFAWRLKNQGPSGLLATSPEAFRESANVVVVQDRSTTNSSWTINNKGIQLTLPFVGIGRHELGLAVLQCAERGNTGLLIAIYLRDISLTMERFERVFCEEFQMLNLGSYRLSQYPPRQICVRQRRLARQKRSLSVAEMEHRELAQNFRAQLVFNPEEKDKGGRTHLSTAAERGDKDLVWLLLTRTDVDIHSVDNVGRTPLTYASTQGHETIVTMILAQGNSHSHWKDNVGRTPLSYAAEGGHSTIAQLLLSQNDMEYDLKDNSGRAPLSYAAEGGHSTIVQLLLSQNGTEYDLRDSDGRSPLSYAAGRGHKAAAELLLNQGAEFDRTYIQGLNPFGFAVEGGHEAIIAMFLDRGVDVKLNHGSSQTVLHCAAQNGYQDILTRLLDGGANIDGKDKQGRTPLIIAADNGQAEITELLLIRGADVGVTDKESRTAVMAAVMRGHKAIVRVFLDRGIDFSSRYSPGHNLLYEAADNGQRDMIALLLGYGASVNVKNGSGWTPLTIAAKSGHKDVVEYLLKNGADVDAKSSSGWTALMWAAENGHEDIALLLLGITTDINEKVGPSGETLLSWATKKGNKTLVGQLCKMGAEVEAKETASISTQNSDDAKPKTKFGHTLSSYIKGQGRFRPS